MKLLGHNILLIFMVLSLAACGAKKINKADPSNESVSELNYLLMESRCSDRKSVMEPVSTEIETTYRDFQARYPMAFFSIPPTNYDYKNPLIVSVSRLESRLSEFRANEKDDSYVQAHLKEMGVAINTLYQEAVRFEGQKCDLSNLKNKKYLDLRPYLEMKDFCLEKSDAEYCAADVVSSLEVNEAKYVEVRTVKMCNAFDKNPVNCQGQYSIKKQTKTLGDLVSFYQKRFHEERFLPLFKLKKSHLKFQCDKNEDSSVIMNLKVELGQWDPKTLTTLTNFVASTWSRGNFKLTIDLVTDTGSDVIKITPTQEFISYVPDNNPTQVFLGQRVDLATQMKVLAHEFGHVLGFPDCYTEFFDNKAGELVYFEMDKNNTNIMCSLKAGVSVPDDYINQLVQNSCIFN